MNRRDALKKSALCAGSWLVGRTLGHATSTGAHPEASLSTGRIRGYLDRGIRAFKGIPYGADTLPRRFMAPSPPAPWGGTRAVVHFGPRAPQSAGHHRTAGYHLPPELGPISEDCLYLNVWSAGARDGRKRPVMFYIHGGAYSSGSANNVLYDGVNLCRQGDVVVITLNHRPNLFGFLHLPQLALGFEESGNAGMLDLVLALKWVRDNIEELGGYPSRNSPLGSPAAEPRVPL